MGKVEPRRGHHPVERVEPFSFEPEDREELSELLTKANPEIDVAITINELEETTTMFVTLVELEKASVKLGEVNAALADVEKKIAALRENPDTDGKARTELARAIILIEGDLELLGTLRGQLKLFKRVARRDKREFDPERRWRAEYSQRELISDIASILDVRGVEVSGHDENALPRCLNLILRATHQVDPP
ncbi:MAG: hypothetical protein ACE5E0_04180, partial [Terriglobia bacterium]